MRIGVIGGGVTGSATAAAFRGYCDEVRVYDVDPARRTNGYGETLQSDVVFVCLLEGAVDDFFQKVVPYRSANFVLKSTVPVGTTRRLAERYGLPNLVHSPEFLTERTAVEDAANPRLNVIGYTYDPRGGVGSCIEVVQVLYASRWPGVLTKYMRSDESELMKLALNGFFSTKVSYWNEIESYCRAMGIDYETVRAACVAEGRVSDLHTHVPGPDGKRGFGGKCLPKDLDQLIQCFDDAMGVVYRRGEALPNAPVLDSVRHRNKWDRNES